MLIHPFMPERSTMIWKQLGIADAIDSNWERALVWGGIAPGTQTARGDSLFPRMEPLGT
jgi:methionyl-tRNA synthetase